MFLHRNKGMSDPLEAPESAHPLLIAFSGVAGSPSKNGHRLVVNVPCLAGMDAEEIFPPVTLESQEPGLTIYRAGDLLLGHGTERLAGADIDGHTRRLYQRMLSACQGFSLYRIWNYVPQINAVVAGLENYRAFCRGRSEMFERSLGSDYKRLLPAASGVGCDDDRITVVFAAGLVPPTHIENPEQVPAYEYPKEHGPRAPSFSRATEAVANGRKYVFISGTAAIKGHATVAPGSLPEQVACTLDNLRLISRATGLGDSVGAEGGWTRHFKVYLRRAEDLLHARSLLEGPLLGADDRVTWLRSDICRPALNIEIEATLVKNLQAHKVS